LRRTIITLTLTLTAFSVSLGQNFKTDIENGLYSSSPDWIFVLQLVSDSLKGIKLTESKHHYDKVTQVLFGFIPKTQIYEPRKLKPDLGKINDILKVNKNHYSIIYKIDSGFNAYNFVKKEIGYDMYFSTYKVKKKDLVNSILSDTTKYFAFSEFTLTDLKELKKLKNFNDISESEFNELMNSIDKERPKYLRQLANSKTKSLYGTIENNEVLVKILLEKKYNPIIRPEDFDRIYKKYRQKR
jgi:hypothetical protein